MNAQQISTAALRRQLHSLQQQQPQLKHMLQTSKSPKDKKKYRDLLLCNTIAENLCQQELTARQ